MSTALPASPVLITGAGGFIGRYLVRRLADARVTVKALLLPDEPRPWSELDGVRVIRGDLTSPEDLLPRLGPAATVIHLAAVVTDWAPWSQYQAVTVDGSRHLLTWAAQQGARTILVSSIAVYGHQLGQRRCDEDLPFGNPCGTYSLAKQMQEQQAWELADGRELNLTVIRPGNVFGPGSRPWLEMVLPLLARGQPTLLGGGAHDAGLCHVENLVDMLILAASHPDAIDRVFNAADGEGISWRRYFGDLARLAEHSAPRSVPRPAAHVLARLGESWWRWTRRPGRPPITREAIQLTARGLHIPTDEARNVLGWRPRVTYDRAIGEIGAYLSQGIPVRP